MKQIVQDYRTGRIELVEVPVPALRAGGALIRTAWSLVSAGTERQTLALARRSLLGKALSRPDLVRQVVQKARLEGVGEAYRQALARLDAPGPLGYSSSGVVLELGPGTEGLAVGDPVACTGFGFASHAEVAFVPVNMLARVPEGVALEPAAFAGVGAIALHGSRLAGAELGSRVVVIGLGLLGLLTVQLLRAAGSHVFGVDVVAERVELARRLGADAGAPADGDVVGAVRAFTGGHGADAVIITATSSSRAPIVLAAEAARERGKIVALGLIRLDAPRRVFYEKELQLIVPRSSGPGVYDARYESKGVDYPLAHVRWTHRRNLEEFLAQLVRRQVDIESLTTHRWTIDQAPAAYETLTSDRSLIAILFSYPDRPITHPRLVLRSVPAAPRDSVRIGMVGAGLFAGGTLLPILRTMRGVKLRGLATATGLSGVRQGEKFGFEYATTSVDDVLDDPEVDAVIIATRHDLHARLVIEALHRRKAVFVEKPLAMTEEELEAVTAAWTTAGVPLMVGFNRRYAPLTQEARRHLSSRAGPTVCSVRVNVGPLAPQSWLLDPEEGGGVVVGEMGHFVDLIQHLCGARSISVFARAAGGGSDLIATITLSDGSIASIVYTVQGDKALERERVEAYRGGIACVIDNFRALTVAAGGRVSRVRRSGIDRGHRGEIEAFIRALRDGAEHPLPFDEYVSATATTLAIMRSLAGGTLVSMEASASSAAAPAAGSISTP